MIDEGRATRCLVEELRQPEAAQHKMLHKSMEDKERAKALTASHHYTNPPPESSASPISPESPPALQPPQDSSTGQGTAKPDTAPSPAANDQIKAPAPRVPKKIDAMNDKDSSDDELLKNSYPENN
jgi:hypothetical protein